MVSSSWARSACCLVTASAMLEDAAEGNALLQRTKLKAALVSEEATRTVSGTTASELRLLESLATAAVRNGDKIDDETKAELRKLLEDELAKSKKQILAAHAADVTECESMLNSFNQHCQETFTSSQTTRKSHLGGQTEELHDTHVDLRHKLKDADTDQNTKCTALTLFNNMLRQDAPLEVPNERDAMKAWWASLKEFLDLQRPQWQTKETACATAEEVRKTTLGQANGAQTSFETDFCAQKAGLHSSCEAYDECYAQSEADIGACNSNAASGEASRKVEWEAIAKIECFAKLLLGDTVADEAGLAACKNLDSSADLAKLDLDDVVQPDQQTCYELENYPCTDAFVSTRYTGLMDVQDCEKCQGGGGASSISVPEVFEPSCPQEEGWDYVADYQDDRSTNDIPNDQVEVMAGFSNKNAYYIGDDELEKLDIAEAQVCAQVSDKGCTSTCLDLTSDVVIGSAIPGWCGEGLSTDLKRVISVLAGGCAKRLPDAESTDRTKWGGTARPVLDWQGGNDLTFSGDWSNKSLTCSGGPDYHHRLRVYGWSPPHYHYMLGGSSFGVHPVGETQYHGNYNYEVGPVTTSPCQTYNNAGFEEQYWKEDGFEPDIIRIRIKTQAAR